MASLVDPRKAFCKRCHATAAVAALIVGLASPCAMSQGTTGAVGSAAGAAASQPGAASAPGALPPLSGNRLPPASGNGLPPMSGNGLPPLSGNGLPPTNATGTTGANNAVNNAAGAVPPPVGTPTRVTPAREAFGMLDRSGQGFVTRGDTNRISGFMGFDYADANRDGRLSPEEFENAWSFYSGQPK